MTEQAFIKSRDERESKDDWAGPNQEQGWERARMTKQAFIKSRDERERASMNEQDFIKSRDERESKDDWTGGTREKEQGWLEQDLSRTEVTGAKPF
jgi:hypothetical protein